MWNKKYSIILSKGIIIFFALITLYILMTVSKTSEILLGLSKEPTMARQPQLIITLFGGGSVALILFYFLYSLLQNIGKKEIFIFKNVLYLRIISWLCFLGGIIALFSTTYWIAWLPVAIIGFFIGLIVRVIQNIFDEAVILKQENDYTI